MVRQRPLCFGALALWDFQLVAQADGGDAEKFVVGFDAAFDVRFQMIRCGDSARFQRAGERAGQSTRERGNDVIDGRWQRRRVLHSIIFRVAAVRAELQRLLEPFDVCVAKRPLLLHQADSRGVNHFAHERLLIVRYEN